MTNPADECICNLIQELASKASRFAISDESRQIYINQIAQLRASMNPTIIQKSE